MAKQKFEVWDQSISQIIVTCIGALIQFTVLVFYLIF